MWEGPVGPGAAVVVGGAAAGGGGPDEESNFWKRLEWREGALPLV